MALADEVAALRAEIRSLPVLEAEIAELKADNQLLIRLVSMGNGRPSLLVEVATLNEGMLDNRAEIRSLRAELAKMQEIANKRVWGALFAIVSLLAAELARIAWK